MARYGTALGLISASKTNKTILGTYSTTVAGCEPRNWAQESDNQHPYPGKHSTYKE